ncbi:MAG: lipoyl domain-containing protein, partial [Micromonosporaceae bacterium]
MADVVMPRLSDTMEEGTISRWLKAEGDPVRRGDVLAEIETDKATMELEAYDEGVLQRRLVPEGATVPIGEPIAVIGEAAPEAPPAAPEAPAAAPAAAAPPPEAPPATPPAAAAPPTPEAPPAAPPATGQLPRRRCRTGTGGRWSAPTA